MDARTATPAPTGPAAATAATEEARARAVVYDFIANFLATPVPAAGDGYVRALAGSVADLASAPGADGSRAAGALAAAVRSVEEDAAEAQRLLAVERTRYVRGLREGSSVKPPFESLWLTPNDALDDIAGVAGAYRAAGFAMDARACQNRPDSLEAECRFMAQLCREQADAADEGDPARVAELAAAQASFAAAHLGRWAPAWCAQAAGQSQSAVLTGILLLAAEFIEDEKEGVA